MPVVITRAVFAKPVIQIANLYDAAAMSLDMLPAIVRPNLPRIDEYGRGICHRDSAQKNNHGQKYLNPAQNIHGVRDAIHPDRLQFRQTNPRLVDCSAIRSKLI